MPALTADGDRGQTTFFALESGKVSQLDGKRHDLVFGFLQASQEVKPVRSCLDEEFSRPLKDFHTSAPVLLMSPAIGDRLDGWQANSLANGDVDSLSNYQEFPSVA
jgi:hypothetical protein